MTDENRFFRFLWRVNAILVLFAGLALIGSLSKDYLSVSRLKALISPVLPDGVSAPAPAEAPVYLLSPLGAGDYMRAYNGAESDLSAAGKERLLVYSRLSGSPDSAPGVASGYVPSVSILPGYFGRIDVNYLAVSGKTGENHWIFAGFNRAIFNYAKLSPAADNGNALEPPTAYLIEVAEADTNKDGVMTPDDRISLYVYRPGDKLAVKLLVADEFLDKGPGEVDKYIVVYRDGKVRKSATFSVPEFKLLSEHPLPDGVK